MDWATIRVPVPREFVVRAGPTDSDEGELALVPRLMGRVPLTMAGHDLGTWTVVGIEMSMAVVQTALPDARFSPPRVATGHAPVYWATLTKVLQ